MSHSWIYDALETAYEACGEEALSSYMVMEESDDYVEIYIYTDDMRAINTFRRFAANYMPYHWRMDLEAAGYSRTIAKFWVRNR